MAEPPSLEESLRDVPAEKLDREVSSNDLKEISKSLTRWPEVSPWLGLTEADEEEIKTKNYRGFSDLKSERLDVLRRWKENQKDGATYRSLVEVFHRAQRLDLVDFVIELLQTATTSQTPPTPPQSPPLSQPSALVEYGKYLRERYMDDTPIFTVQWPPLAIKRAFNLAMIKQTQIQRGEISDEFVRLTVTGKVDDILNMKSPILLEDIFKANQKKRKVVLIEGAPGAGKSTLSWDICKRWGEGELFQEYKAVILVQLRDPEVQAAQKLADILPAKDDALAESIASQMVACEGKKVLFVLDGWDELPDTLKSKSLYRELIKPPKKACLCKHAVIVTSRPISSGQLHPLVSSRVEIIGFTPEELRQYFSECLSGDSRAVKALLERVEENPVVASSCYLPLNAAIIVHLFLSGNQSLPTTVHGIFTSLVLCCLSRYQIERLGLKGEAANLESLDRLPKNLQKDFRQLCSLAFLGVAKDRDTFSSTDLEALGIRTDVSALGLLQAVPSIVSHKVSVYYNFLHLQIQELLAAYHISSLSASEQISHFQTQFNQSRFAAVFQFYAGITRFQSRRQYLSRVAFLLPASSVLGIRDVITSMIQGSDGQVLISVIRCLFEADDPSLCQFVADQLKRGLDLSGTTLSPLDCLSVGYFLSCVCATTSGEFTVDLYDCSIDDHCCKFLMRGLSRCPVPNATATAQLSMNFLNNSIREEGAHYIAQVLRSSSKLQKLILYRNGIGEAGLKSIAEALTSNSSLVVLNLRSCSIEITEESAPLLRAMLQKNNTLRVLDLSSNDKLSDTGVFFVAEALKGGSSLRELNLNHCRIKDEGVKSLGDALLVNDSLETLHLRRNAHISEEGVSVLTECLKRNSGLVNLWLPQRFSSFGVQEIINVSRSGSTPSITVEYSTFVNV